MCALRWGAGTHTRAGGAGAARMWALTRGRRRGGANGVDDGARTRVLHRRHAALQGLSKLHEGHFLTRASICELSANGAHADVVGHRLVMLAQVVKLFLLCLGTA